MNDLVLRIMGALLIITAIVFAVWQEWASITAYVGRYMGLKPLNESEALTWVSRRVALWCGVLPSEVPPSQPLKECHIRQLQRRVRYEFGLDLSGATSSRPTVQDVARVLAALSQRLPSNPTSHSPTLF